MGFSKEKKIKIKDFMITLIDNEINPYEKTLNIFKVSRQTLGKYLKELEYENIIEVTGGRTRKLYSLKKKFEVFKFSNDNSLEEEVVYEESIMNNIGNIKKNVKDIIHYTSTEIINNAIDHSSSKKIEITISQTYTKINIYIKDNGIGIFKKIMKDFELPSEDEAIFQLHKGKLTSDNTKHSGEGIFFTSRACDWFGIVSYDKAFSSCTNEDHLESHYKSRINGTLIMMEFHRDSEKNLIEIFEKYQDDDYGFSKTEVRIKLAEQFASTLISRSQAKRVLAGFNNFKDIILDFKNVNLIGQGFADQIFRIYQLANPQIKIVPINMNEKVGFMIKHVLKRSVELEK